MLLIVAIRYKDAFRFYVALHGVSVRPVSDELANEWTSFGRDVLNRVTRGHWRRQEGAWETVLEL